MSPTIEVANLYKKYGKIVALANVSLSIKEGQIVGLCGPNGSGKSTFLRILTGIVKPTRGYINILGDRPSKANRKAVAYVSENDVFYKWMRVEDHLKFIAGFYEDFNIQKAFELVKAEGIGPKLKVGELSRGNRQRLKVISAVSRSPRILLLDEPFSGIDMVSRERIMLMVRDFLFEGGRTAIISTHFVEGLEGILERVVFFKEGNVVLDEICEELRIKYEKSVKSIYFEIFGGEK
ncbi:MAG TPA: ABC transporter ATP-binding protein [Candidatus Hydrothermia bacterium]|nr:ABC transporter ATP-binding protein [Candidatus Hydrothermia bacterium]